MQTVSNNGNIYYDPKEFLEESCYQSPYVLYNGRTYFFNGTVRYPGETQITYSVWPMDDGEGGCTIKGDTAEEVLEIFQKTPCFDGKTFWEAEKDMVWIE